MRNETDAAALAEAAAQWPALVTCRTSDQILQGRCKSLASAGGRAEDCALVEHPQNAGWNRERAGHLLVELAIALVTSAGLSKRAVAIVGQLMPDFEQAGLQQV
jgi:hypothetical protein